MGRPPRIRFHELEKQFLVDEHSVVRRSEFTAGRQPKGALYRVQRALGAGRPLRIRVHDFEKQFLLDEYSGIGEVSSRQEDDLSWTSVDCGPASES